MEYLLLLEKAREKRLSLINPETDNCWRIVNGEIDRFPGLTIDVYGEWLLIQYYANEAKRYIDPLLGLLREGFFPFEVKGVLLKDRTKESGGTSDCFKSLLLAGSYPPEEYTVMHNGMQACVDLVHAQNTGVFMDMRSVREALCPYYGDCGAGARVLNLFAYTSLFSVHALKHGMKSAENIDLSNVVLERARRNYAVNGIDAPNRDFVRTDSVSYMKRAARKERIYDLVIIDPPTFSRYKGSSFSVQRDMPKLIDLAAQIAGGYVLSAVNCHRITQKDYESFHPRSWKRIFIQSEAADFAGTFPYLKVGLWKVR